MISNIEIRDKIIYEKIIDLIRKQQYIDYDLLIKTIGEDLRENHPEYGKIRVENYIEDLKNKSNIGFQESEESCTTEIYIRRDFNYEKFKKINELNDWDFSPIHFTPEYNETKSGFSFSSIFKNVFYVIRGLFSWALIIIFGLGVLLLLAGIGTVIMPVIGIIALIYFIFLISRKNS